MLGATFEVSAFDPLTRQFDVDAIETTDRAFAFEYGNHLYARYGNAKVIHWHVSHNLPGAWPSLRHYSVALFAKHAETNGQWHEVYIHG